MLQYKFLCPQWTRLTNSVILIDAFLKKQTSTWLESRSSDITINIFVCCLKTKAKKKKTNQTNPQVLTYQVHGIWILSKPAGVNLHQPESGWYFQSQTQSWLFGHHCNYQCRKQSWKELKSSTFTLLAVGMAFTMKVIFLFVTLPLPLEVQNSSRQELSSPLFLLIFLIFGYYPNSIWIITITETWSFKNTHLKKTVFRHCVLIK